MKKPIKVGSKVRSRYRARYIAIVEHMEEGWFHRDQHGVYSKASYDMLVPPGSKAYHVSPNCALLRLVATQNNQSVSRLQIAQLHVHYLELIE